MTVSTVDRASAYEQIAADYPDWHVTHAGDPGQWVASHDDVAELVAAVSPERLLARMEIAELERKMADPGLYGRDPQGFEAAKGMGYDDYQVVMQVEVPVASPVIFTAIRIAAVQVVATVPIGALAASGGLGRYIIEGFAQRRFGVIYAGILLIAVLAILTERLLDLIERRVIPRGLRGREEADVAAKLVAHFVSDEPPARAVDRVAKVFLDTQGDLRAVSAALIDLFASHR